MSQCLDSCRLNGRSLKLDDIHAEENRTLCTLNAQKGGTAYHLEYAPVGNQPRDPLVILCGKTPGSDTAEQFQRILRQTGDLETAAFRSVYSRMRNNLFNYLSFAGLFDWLRDIIPYWQQDRSLKDLWDGMFTDVEASRHCGIQLTQAVNCAILEGRSGDEPTRKAFNEVWTSEPRCFFNRVMLSNSLRLVIFLDTPFDQRFHQADYWTQSSIGQRAESMGIKTISITHPSGQNNLVYRHLSEIAKVGYDDPDTRKANASRLLRQAIKTIGELRDTSTYR